MRFCMKRRYASARAPARHRPRAGSRYHDPQCKLPQDLAQIPASVTWSAALSRRLLSGTRGPARKRNRRSSNGSSTQPRQTTTTGIKKVSTIFSIVSDGQLSYSYQRKDCIETGEARTIALLARSNYCTASSNLIRSYKN